jgi:hypothetical protein
VFCVSESLGLPKDKWRCMTLKMDFSDHSIRWGMVSARVGSMAAMRTKHHF